MFVKKRILNDLFFKTGKTNEPLHNDVFSRVKLKLLSTEKRKILRI